MGSRTAYIHASERGWAVLLEQPFAVLELLLAGDGDCHR